MQAQLYRANSTPTVDAGPKAAAATDRQLPPSTSAATATAPVGKIPNAVRSRTGSRGCSVGAGDLSGLPDRDGAGERTTIKMLVILLRSSGRAVRACAVRLI